MNPDQPLPGPSATAPLGPRDGGSTTQRPANANSNVPSGPRFQPHPPFFRDANHSDFSRGTRMPPSGPSAASTIRGRGHPSNEMAITPHDSPALRDRDSMDVDITPPSRAVGLRMNDQPIRAGSGMYADREPTNTDLPKGPRAMSSKVSANTAYPPTMTSPPTSPTMSFPPQRNVSGQDYAGNGMRERSPVPRQRNNDGWDQYRGRPERPLPSGSGTARFDAGSWKSDFPREDDHQVKRNMGHQQIDGYQV